VYGFAKLSTKIFLRTDVFFDCFSLNNFAASKESVLLTVKTVRFVEYKAGSDVPIDIKDPRTGSEASDTSHPTIANYEYVTGNLKDGILYHVYRSNTATNAGNNNQNQSTTTSGGQFKTENGKVYYIKDGKKVSGWQKIDDKTYYFEADGAMKKGLLTAGDKQYYLDEKDGVKKLGFVKVADKTYYFVEDGEKKTGFVIRNKGDK